MSETKINLTPELQEQLAKISVTGYSCNGYPPARGEWDLTPDQVRQIIKNHTKTFLTDVKDVTLEVNHNTGSVYGYVWLPNNSKHVCDTELNTQNAAINRTMTKYSSQLNEYMDKFCAKNKKRVVAAEGNVPMVGIEVLVDKFMRLEFDETGIQYGRLFGESNKRKTRITCSCEFTKGDDGRYGKLCIIHVSKSLRTGYNSLSPRPKKSYNAR